jgi:hypothetical protein
MGSLLEIVFHDSCYADKFPGIREDHIVVLSLKEVEEGLADAMVQNVRNAASIKSDRDQL